MKYCLTLLFFLFLNHTYAVSQTIEIDSLKSLLSSERNNDKRMELLDLIANKSTFTSLDTAEVYANRLLKLATDQSDNNFKVKAFYKLGDIARRRYEMDLALTFATKADSLANTTLNRGKINNLYGIIYLNKNSYDSALIFYDRGIKNAREARSWEDVVKNMNGMGMVYFRKGEYPKALETNLKALNLIDSAQLDTPKGSIYGVIGVIYQNLSDYQKAYQNYELAIESDSLLGDTRGIITWKINWAIALQNDQKAVEAESMYLSSYEDSKTYGYPALEANVLANLGSFYKGEYQVDKAIETFKQSYEKAKELQISNIITFDLQNLGDLFMQKSNPKGALPYLMESKSMAYKLGAKNSIMDVHKYLSNYFEKTQRPDSALKHFKLYKAFQDSIFDESKLSEIGKLEAEYEYDKQKLLDDQKHQQEMKVEQAKQKTQQTIIIISLIGVVIIGALLIFIYRRLQIISRQKKIIEKQNKELETKSEKLKGLDIAKSNFFSNISHDLRSPLTLILGSIDQVLEEEKLTSKSKELLESGYRNSKKLLFMTDEIRDLSRLQEGKMDLKLQLVRIDAYLNLLVKMFSSAATLKRIILKFHSELSEERIVRIDPHQFEKIIYNLLSNAVKHTEELGSITLTVKDHSEVKNQLLIEIKDTGIGIPQNLTQHIFDRYYQVPSQLPGETVGLGIGLALCKEIVELHQGEIWVESKENEGTTFTITLNYEPNVSMSDAIIDEYYDPIYSPMEITAQENLQLTDEKHNQTILVVEDHREIRQFISHILSTNYNLLLAKNGHEALSLLQSEKVDLIISDLMMPYMDGFELIKAIKETEQYQHIPVLIVSARTNEDDKLLLLRDGAEDIIAKPFSPNELRLKLSNLLQKKSNSERILKMFEPSNSQTNAEYVISKKLENLILSKVDDPNLSVIDLSNELAASERKVFRLIKKIYNMTPLELIKETRWKYLEEYLKKSEEITATEAASKIGLGNVTYFKKQFKDRFDLDYDQYMRNLIVAK